ncbi:uncharacterized protein Z518_07309 [Rhinocladiella mackenziei CBS 650.93]|uniref:Zn(2)-C6 fungal-type domain-containing protein n=1 Tax=Rhinocladiella mackenziei CBS 650.93 TaxID=1442369 RepID=A0A0D2IKK1_9EURO|nr:uncharacterized protein Z518_07309 [Rhinocladiella mackenziei CBS 650.93]KIX03756.1 hypothetical protein Z518_07309 [Rhinocladiella mackenziei CBS 650.93]
MAEFSSLTHKFRANLDHQQQGGNKISKRNRQPLSCAPCRIKKLKCDRGHPCETCIKKGDQASCTYGKTAPIFNRSEAHTNAVNNHNNNGRSKAQERLRHLEQLVMQMVDNSVGPSQPSESMAAASPERDAPNPTIATEGHLQVGSSEARYVGSTHWSAILENIQELKTALGSEHTSSTELDESEDIEPQGPECLFGSPGNLSLAQILAQALPPRLQVDRRLSTYFNSRYLVIPFIHTTQFQRQYEQFWRAPLEAPPLWVSILFSICCMSATLSEAVGSEPSTPEDQPSPRMNFLTAASQCLRLGGFVRPKRYVVEALALHAQCKYMSTLDPAREVGIIFTVLVRLAFRSGYHRDPSQFPHFSVFEGEMRRRSWAMLRQFDLMVSFQLGLPNLIPPNSWDTLPPRNLLDTDFDEHTTILPPSRPENEATQILYFIVKSRLMTSFGKVCAHALTFRECKQKELMELDAEVRETYKTVPDTLRIKPMSQSFADPSYLIMVRLNCEFLFQKSICVLHRKYMTQGGYPASTAACTDAAIAITKHMLDLHKEFQPGGQLFADRWMLSSFTMNDFYLASMVLCLGISMWKKAHPGKGVNEDERMESQHALLRSAFEICEELSPTSTEAKRVANVLRVVLGEMGTPGSAWRGSASASGSSMSTSQQGPSTTSSSSGSSTQPPPRLLQPSRFGGSAFFPSPYDFNLAPLSLNDRDMSSSSSSVQMADANQPGEFFNLNMPLPTPRLEPSPSLGPNPFTSFLPFSLSYPPNQHSSHPSIANTNMSSPDSTATNPNPNLNVDVDWAFLDQWMALPDQEILPVNDGGSIPMTFNGAGAGVGIGVSDPNTSMTTPGLDVNAEWSSAPYRFLGGEILRNIAAREEAEAQAERQQQRQQQGDAQGEMDGVARNQSQDGVNNSGPDGKGVEGYSLDRGKNHFAGHGVAQYIGY